MKSILDTVVLLRLITRCKFLLYFSNLDKMMQFMHMKYIRPINHCHAPMLACRSSLVCLTAGLITLASMGEVRAATVYAMDLQFQRFVSFDSATPGTQTVIATGISNGYRGMDFTPDGKLFAVNQSTRTLDQLSILDGSSISSVVISGVIAGEAFSGITFMPGGQTFLSATTGSLSALYNLDISTGAATQVGTMGSLGLVIDIAANSSGQLVAHDILTDGFYFVNPLTAAVTPIGTHGIDANFSQGMDFDPVSGELYAAVFGGPNETTYGTISITTGAITPIPGILAGEYEMAFQIVPEPSHTLLFLSGMSIFAIRRKRQS